MLLLGDVMEGAAFPAGHGPVGMSAHTTGGMALRHRTPGPVQQPTSHGTAHTAGRACTGSGGATGAQHSPTTMLRPSMDTDPGTRAPLPYRGRLVVRLPWI